MGQRYILSLHQYHWVQPLILYFPQLIHILLYKNIGFVMPTLHLTDIQKACLIFCTIKKRTYNELVSVVSDVVGSGEVAALNRASPNSSRTTTAKFEELQQGENRNLAFTASHHGDTSYVWLSGGRGAKYRTGGPRGSHNSANGGNNTIIHSCLKASRG